MTDTAIDFDPRTGEMKGGCHRCQTLEAQLAGTQQENAAWHIKYQNLKKKVNTEIKDHPRYEEVKEVYEFWKRECNHMKSPFTKDRFESALPFVEKYGVEMCKRGVEGLAFDAYRVQRRNGSWRVYNDFQRHLFKDAGTFEERCNSAPLERSAA